MHGVITRLGALAILLGVAGPASAGYWEVVYDLTGSTTTTVVTAASSTDVDPVTGSFTIQYDGPQAGPVTGARLVAGNTNLDMYQNPGPFVLTGDINTVLAPPPGGVVGGISGATLNGLSGIPNAVTGFIHCYDGFQPCSAAGYTNTTPTPQTPPSSTPMKLGNFVFNGPVGAASATKFTSTGVLVTIPPSTAAPYTVSLTTVYVGQEISRVWNAGSAVPAVSQAGRIGLGLFLGLAGASILALHRGRRAGRAG